MKPTFVESYGISALSIILGTLAVAPTANSQPVTPANDGTGTTVTPQGNQFNIEGGTRNGANLFHSFDQFNVNSGQIANFLTTPDTRNILGRVTGGNASYVNGLIQVIGGNSNLFLMNPAGIMFGRNASLNIPASFSLTTATGIGFDNNNFWFQAMGTNDYSNLVGNPSGYRFNVSNPGAIVNEGNLSLNPGENLTLLGGTVINTGELSTAGGNITIAAVEGGNTLRISQPGHLLSLEVNSTTANGEDISGITPLSLATLLTGGEIAQATSVIVNANGEILLTDSNTLVADTPGDAIVSGNINVSIPPNPRSTKSAASSGFPLSKGDGRGIEKGGDMNSLALSKGDGRGVGGQVNVLGDRVALLNTNINADGINGGGNVLIGGDFQGNGIVPNSQQTFINKNSIISADAISNGDGGRVIVWSDRITNFAGNITAKGGQFSGDGGFVEVSGKQQLIFNGTVNVSAAFGNPGTILLDPENVTVGKGERPGSPPPGSPPPGSPPPDSPPPDSPRESPESPENPVTETPIDPFEQNDNPDVTISAENIGELSGDVILQADNDITINEQIKTDSSVELKAGRSININADIDTSIGNGNIDLLGNNDEMNIAKRSDGKASINQLDGTTLNAGSGRINIELGNLGEVGDINLANLTTTGQVLVNANGGNIAKISNASIINAGSALFQTSGNGGIGLTNAPLQLDVENLEAVSGSGGVFFDVGDVNIGGVSENVNGIATIGGGDLILESEGDVTVTEDIRADVVADGETGGDINITAKNLSVINDGAVISASTFAKGNAGSVEIDATDTVVFDGADSEVTGVFSNVESGAVGNAGGIAITTESLEVKNGAVVGSVVRPRAEGNGGDVTITTGSLEVKNGAVISTTTFGIGNAGRVEIDTTETVLLDGENSEFTGVVSIVGRGAVGNAGDITVTTGSLEVKNGAVISANTSGKGNAGKVEIHATETVVLDGGDPAVFTGITSSVQPGAVGNARGVTITTGSLEVKNGTLIDASNGGKGDAGNVEIHATETVVLDGGDFEFTGISSGVQPRAEGDGGDVTITTRSLEVKNGAQISASNGGKGNLGNVEINATETVVLDGGDSEFLTGIGSRVRPGAEENEEGGNISITANSLEVRNGAEISANTFANGPGGNIKIEATEIVNLDNDGKLLVETRGAGKAGNIEIKSPEVNVGTNSVISAEATKEATNTEEGGNITIGTNTLNISNSEIFAQTQSETPAGTITLKPYNNNSGLNINFSNKATISANTQSTGEGGKIFISAPETIEIVGDGQIVAGSNGAGKAGNLEINTQQLTIAENARIRVSTIENSTNTEGGTISIYANRINISSSESSESKSEISAET